MRANRILVLVLVAVATVAMWGCNRSGGGTNDALPLGPTAATLPAGAGTPAPTARVQMSLQLDPAPTPAAAAGGTVAGALRADVLPASVTVKLTSINIGDTANPTTTQEQTATVGTDRRATVTFTSVPAMPTLAEVSISNGSIGTYTQFRGAADLVAGPNTITVNGSGSKEVHDVTAGVFARVLTNPTLRGKVAQGFVAAARQVVEGLDRTTDLIADEACAMVAVRTLEPPVPATFTVFPTLTNASLAGKWVLIEQHDRARRHVVLDVLFDGIDTMTWTEIWASNQVVDPAVRRTSYSVAADGEVTLGSGQRYPGGVIYTDGRRMCYTSFAPGASFETTDNRNAVGIRKRTGVTMADMVGTWRGMDYAPNKCSIGVATMTSTGFTYQEAFNTAGTPLSSGGQQNVTVDAEGLFRPEGWPEEPQWTDGDLLIGTVRDGDTGSRLSIWHRSVTGLSTAAIVGNWRSIEFGYGAYNWLRHHTVAANGSVQHQDIRTSEANPDLGSWQSTWTVPSDGGGTGGLSANAWHTDGRTIVESGTATDENWMRLYLRRP